MLHATNYHQLAPPTSSTAYLATGGAAATARTTAHGSAAAAAPVFALHNGRGEQDIRQHVRPGRHGDQMAVVI